MRFEPTISKAIYIEYQTHEPFSYTGNYFRILVNFLNRLFITVEEILENYEGNGDYNIPQKYSMQRSQITDQLNVIVEKNLYIGKNKTNNIPE